MGAGIHGGFGSGTQGAKDNAVENSVTDSEKNDTVSTEENTELTTEDLISELKERNVKFTEENIVFITKDATGQTVWLEKGSASAGLEHILNGDGRTQGHAGDFERAFGISREKIPEFLHKVVSEGKVVSNKIKIKNGREGYERVYYYDGKHYVLTGVGENGFIVSAYPVEC